MNKKLVSVAVGLAFAVGSTAVLAEGKVYAKAHVTLDSVSVDVPDGSDDPDSTVNVTSNRGSRLGYKFNYDLGNEMEAFGQIEFKADFSKDGTNGDDRPSFVGLKGAFGAVALGHQDNPYKNLGREVELMGDTVADARAVTMIDNSTGALSYSNSFDNFSFTAGYTPEDGEEEETGFSVNGMFENNGLLLGAAYESNGTGPADDNKTESGVRLAGGYDFGDFRVVALWENITNSGGTDGNDFSNMGIGAAYKVGSNTFAAQYYVSESDEDDMGGSLFGLGAFHDLNKNITLYLAYAGTSNEDATNSFAVSAEMPQAGGDDVDIDGGGSTSALSLGTIVKF